MITSIKRSDPAKGLDEIFGYTASDVETVRKITSHIDFEFEELIRDYELCLDTDFSKELYYTSLSSVNPETINQFLQLTLAYENHHNYCVATGKFISDLVENSFENLGHTDFFLNTTNLKPIHYLFEKINYTKKLNVNIVGDIGNECFINSENLNVYVKGNAKNDISSYGHNNTIKIDGSVGDWFAFKSSNCNIYVKGNVGNNCSAQSKRNYLVVGGTIAEKLLSRSHDVTCAVRGKVDEGIFLGRCKQLKLYLPQNFADLCADYYKLNEINLGEDAQNHKKYKEMMDTLDEVFK